MQSFDKLSYIAIKDESTTTRNESKSSRAVLLYYSTTDIKVSTTSMLISLSSFISSIGGNLGLFVGFSFLSVFLLIYKYLMKIWKVKKPEKLDIDNDSSPKLNSNQIVIAEVFV